MVTIVVPVMTVRRSLWAAAATLMIISACARTPDPDIEHPMPPSTGGSSVPPAAGWGSDPLALRLIQEGGFVPADRIVGRIPEISIYQSGRVITQGPQIAIYPGPALPNLQVNNIGPDKVLDIVRQAQAAGVRGGADLGQPSVADAPSTRIDVILDGQMQSVSANALGEATPDDPRLTPAQREARAKLVKFVADLRALGGGEQATAYRPDKVAALAQPYSPPDDGLPSQPAPAPWPGAALPGENLNPNVKIGCVVAEGSEAVKILDAAAKASQNTAWTSGGNQWSVTFRPLLPEETGCADLKKAR